MRITVLGSRGSMPTADPAMAGFGGATSCYCVQAQGQTVFLDAGTGLMSAACGEGPISILLSHTHVDHILGLPLFPALLQPGREIHIYGKTREGLTVEQQLARLISRPLWPLRLEEFPARAVCHELSLPLTLGGITVEGMEACHPGGSTVLKLTAGGCSLVYATDFEHSEEKCAELASFAKGASLLLYDGQYTEDEYAARRGFGHSTPAMGLRVRRESGAGRLLLIHHDPKHTDAMLRETEERLGVRFAREGDVVTL